MFLLIVAGLFFAGSIVLAVLISRARRADEENEFSVHVDPIVPEDKTPWLRSHGYTR